MIRSKQALRTVTVFQQTGGMNPITYQKEIVKTVLNDVYFQDDRAKNISSGNNDLDYNFSLQVHEKFNFNLGDYVVLGEVEEDYTDFTDIRNNNTNCFEVTIIQDFWFGFNPHLEILGK